MATRPKTKPLPKPRVEDPYTLLTIAQSRPLRIGEIAFLTKTLRSAQRRASVYEADHTQSIASDELHLALEGNALLRCHFPGQHTIRIPLSSLTQHDKAIAMECLLRILRERAGEQRNTVGRGGAPVQYDLTQILREIKSSAPIRKVGKRPPPKDITDFLDLDNLNLEDLP